VPLKSQLYGQLRGKKKNKTLFSIRRYCAVIIKKDPTNERSFYLQSIKRENYIFDLGW